jgi:uncharacterized protein
VSSSTALPTPPLYPARPTLRVDGEAVAELGDRALSLTVDEDTAGMRRCEVRFGNWGETERGLGLALSDRAVVDLGTALAVELGAGDRAGTVFEGVVTGIEEHYPADGPPELVALAEDRLQDLRMTRRTRTFADVADADVLTRIAGEHGLQADVDVDGPTHPILAQVAQSDLAFLRDRARAVDAYLWVRGTTLHARGRREREPGTVRLVYGADLQAFRVLADLSHQRTTVTVSGWDVAAKDTVRYDADAAAVQPELDGNRSGPATLAATLGPRVDQVVHRTPWAADEARALAEAAFRERARRFLTGHGRAEGDARIEVGAVVDLAGLSSSFAGEYHVTETSHRFDGTAGYRTTFRVERPWLGGAP